jgi:hypothetical protein
MGMANIKLDDQQDGAGCNGLCLHLGEEQIKALGLDKHLPAEGAKVSIRAIATVRRAVDADDAKGADDEQAEGAQPESADESEEGGTTLELHISSMEVTQNGREPASVLYGGKQG